MTIKLIYCPGCDYLVPASDRVCPHCQLDLKDAHTLLQQTINRWQSAENGSVNHEEHVLLGEFLLSKKLISHSDLSKALHIQAQIEETGGHIFLGQALVEMGVLSSERLDACIAQHMLSLKLATTAKTYCRLQTDKKVNNENYQGSSEALRTVMAHWQLFINEYSPRPYAPAATSR